MQNRRSYSTNLSDHEGLICKFAFAALGRLSAAGVVHPDLDDIKQDMRLSMHLAAQRWSPDAGVSFTAYAGRAIWNNFNKYAERAIEHRIPEITESDLIKDGSEQEDFFAFFDTELDESVESRVEQVSDMRAKLHSLSVDAKRVVFALLDPESDKKPTFTVIGRSLGFNRAHMLKVRCELADQFGLETL